MASEPPSDPRQPPIARRYGPRSRSNGPKAPDPPPSATARARAYRPEVASTRPTASPKLKRPAPEGKVKASFNLLPEEISSLRAMAERLGTTVTNVLQRAIRDERFVQDQLAEGNRFAVIDREGTTREIIWR